MGTDFDYQELQVPKPKPIHLEMGNSWPTFAPLSPLLDPRPSAHADSVPAQSGAPAPKKEYVDLRDEPAEKAQMLGDLMDKSKAVLSQNGLADGSDSVLAGLMMNEGGRNQRRQQLGRHFSGEASGLSQYLQQKGVDVNTLAKDPNAYAAFRQQLGEDQQFILDRVAAGQLDLSALKSKDKAVREAEREKLTEVGIDKRTEQYAEMERLQREKGEQGKNFSAAHQTRLDNLQNMDGKAVGFDGLDAGSNFGDMAGLSESRFREIYTEGQQRFEPRQYRKLRDDYDSKVDAYQAGDQKKPLGITTGKYGIGSGKLALQNVQQMQKCGNHDLIGDLSTSYGTAQIMGLYGYNGNLHAKDESGTNVSYDLSALKQSQHRLSPTVEDVNMQISCLNYKAGYNNKTLNNMLNDTGVLTTQYNGAQPGTPKYNKYKGDLDFGKALYDSEKSKAAKKKKFNKADAHSSIPEMPSHGDMCKISDGEPMLMSPFHAYED